MRNPFVFELFICSDDAFAVPTIHESNSYSLISFFETSCVFLSEEVFFFRTLKSFYVFFATNDVDVPFIESALYAKFCSLRDAIFEDVECNCFAFSF